MTTTAHHLAYPARNGTEQDATSRAARRVLVSLGRAGVAKAAKTAMHRRERRNARRDLDQYAAV